MGVTNLGSLSLNADGTYTYTVANSATQYLQLVRPRLTSSSWKPWTGRRRQYRSLVTGTNDAAVIGTPSVASVTEDAAVNGWGNLTASGSISISDADTGQALFKTAVTAPVGVTNLGSLSLNADGTYTYTVANSATQYLAAGATKIDQFIVEALDGTKKTDRYGHRRQRRSGNYVRRNRVGG